MKPSLVHAALAAFLAVVCPPAFSQNFTLTKIIDTNTVRPDGGGNFQNPHSPSTDGNYAGFFELTSGGSLWAANLNNNFSLAKLADTTTVVPGGTGAFTGFGQTAGGNFSGYSGYSLAVRNGTVVFLGLDSVGNGVYSIPATGGTMLRVVNYNVTLPDGGKLGAAGHNIYNIGFNDSGNVVFDGPTAGNAGDGNTLGASVYTANTDGSNLVLIANEDHLFVDPLLPAGISNPCVQNFQGAAIGGSSVVFFGIAPGNFWGIYSLPVTGPAQGVAAQNCGSGPTGPLIISPANAKLPGDPSSNPVPDISFIQTDGQAVYATVCDFNYACGSSLNGGWEGIYSVPVSGGGFTKIVATGDSLPSIGTVTDIAGEFSVDNGGIVFMAANNAVNPAVRGIFLSRGGQIQKIWATGDSLAGENVNVNGNLEISPESYKNGKLVFVLSGVVFLATPSSGSTGITIQTNPEGLQFSIDNGALQTAPVTVNLASGQHTLSVATTQAGGTGTQYVFSSWSDGGSATHTITVGSSSATYTATFTTQYQLTITASPAGGGTISPGSGYYNSGSVVSITAQPASGYAFAGWTGSTSVIGSTSSPATTITMNGPESAVANFSSSAFTLTPAFVTIGAGGGTGTVSVTTTSSGGWTASSQSSFLIVTSGSSGAGNGTVGYSVAANSTGSTRTGTILIAGQTFTVTQSGTGTSSGLAFYPVTPCRVVDTRTTNGTFGGPILAAGQTRNFPIQSGGCNIPNTAQAYSLNITVVPPAPLGYLTSWPTGQAQPNVSTLNSSNGAVVANAAVVPAGTGGQISIFVSDSTHVVIDINGYFAPQSAQGLAFYPVTPCRVADTRNTNGTFGGPSLAAGQTRNFPVPQSACSIPASAQAFSLNMTVVPPGPMEYLTAWPAGAAQPYVSTLNALQGQVAANAAIVPAGSGGNISVFVSDATNVVIDINGYFAPPGGSGALYFYALPPCRAVDTRTANGVFGGPALPGGSTRTFPISGNACSLPTTAQAYSLNMTVAPPGQMFYLTVWPEGQAQPYVSTLNDLQGQIIANAAIVPAGSGGVSVFVSDPTNLIIDVNGYFAP